ncbi:histidine triad nucleotide-binding protein [Candidatus Marsarchaeota G2 archaeon ECH_B_2]|uniref:Histidine triad nucleotide-binding protein n=2 Tax=Candidatus Marsarchaeota group 2 TaxID=2203771 RepID=A0A2R6BCU0_9ARCH|nr:MAG: histidine triad nucleotide-binding protein [Candidatus Marsarchaeota G2 archaeon ECH_B_2]PSO03031.1 MAG: histidine triad nucleotide-binding protein [Candidatus Marsarchaeota G2 archaeon ECH_B_1]
MVDAECVFCSIISGRLPSARVHESDNFVVIKDINPVAPVHLLVIPKRHVESVLSVSEDFPAGEFFDVVKRVAEQEGLRRGFRLVVNTGIEAQQSVPHMHAHILGGRSFTWPPG